MLIAKELIPIFMLAVALIEISLEYKWRDKRTKTNKIWRTILIALLIISAVITIIIIYFDHKHSATYEVQIKSLELQIKSLQERIETLRSSGIIGGKIIVDSSKDLFPKIQIGDKGPFFQGDFSIFKKRGLEVKLINGQIYVSISVADSQGNIIAEVKDNEWIKSTRAVDRNYSSDSFEVKDEKGRVVLQIRLKENVLQFQGILYDPEKNLLWLIAQRERDGRMDGFIEVQEPGKSFSYAILPIFKYPANEHLGELAN
jgi:hypothetical protein